MEHFQRFLKIFGPLIGLILLYFVVRYGVLQFQVDAEDLNKVSPATLEEVTQDPAILASLEEPMGEEVAEDEVEAAAEVDEKDAEAADEAAANVAEAEEVMASEAVDEELADVRAETDEAESAAADGDAAEAEAAADAAAVSLDDAAESVDDASAAAEAEVEAMAETDSAETAVDDAAEESAAEESAAEERAAEESAAEESAAEESAAEESAAEESAAEESAAEERAAEESAAEESAADSDEAADSADGDETVASPLVVAGHLWMLETLNDSDGESVELTEEGEYSATFADGSLSGATACSNYAGKYQVDSDTLTVAIAATSPIEGASDACTDGAAMEAEESYLAALQSAATFTVAEESLEISDEDGNVVLIFGSVESE